MITIRNIKMPDNCHECDAIGLSDIVGLGCPCDMDREKYSFTERPKECPLIWENTICLEKGDVRHDAPAEVVEE